MLYYRVYVGEKWLEKIRRVYRLHEVFCLFVYRICGQVYSAV